MQNSSPPPGAVVIGMDPHKRSVTIEVMNSDEQVLDGGRFNTDSDGFTRMLAHVAAYPERVWAIEGCAGIGRHVAARLITAGESVVDVPAKLSYRVRLLTAGNGRKTDDTDAHSIALIGVRVTGLRPVVSNEQIELLRVLVDRRRMLGEEHTRKISQVHRLLLELIPGGAKIYLSARQARKLLSPVRPKDPAGKARKQLAMELITDLEKVYTRTKQADKDLLAALAETGTHLTELHGIGPTGAAMLLVEVGDITRFPDHNHFASWTGTAPIDASSGDTVRHRLSRGGNRQINRVLHTMATVQLRNPTEGRAYYDRKKRDGKSSMEAMRCLKRRLSDIVYRTMLTDLTQPAATGPGGQPGDDSDSSATGSQPTTGSSDKPLPGPATTQPTRPLPAAS
ncbi:transposase [Branchiibius hedensis]|uniref:Transposase n=1 Tax=Branchiibius hedensis TaxID=672460 RepID=A0A2Y8ZUZ1_9MICO|nr:IS110 family transposase [Branchiibius hedensis]PWJ26286.1 transposase [Branchiibius hedensis]SSA35098.1 Transposase [Branchiibius hedensis]